jgi:hypothetical protein
MAPPRKNLQPGRGHPVYLRLPEDIFTRIEAKAKAEGRPFNRIAVNELAAFPHLDRLARLGELVSGMEVTLAKYSMRIRSVDVGEALLRAVDDALAARTDGQLQPQLDRLRVVRMAMLENERQAAKGEREQLADRIEQIERKIGAIEALPDSAIAKDDLPALKDELARLQQAASSAPANEKVL